MLRAPAEARELAAWVSAREPMLQTEFADLRDRIAAGDRSLIERPRGESAPPWGVSLGARYSMYCQPEVSVAPWIVGSLGDADRSTGLLGFHGMPGIDGPQIMAGVAVEGGGRRFRFDATVPFATWEAKHGVARSLAWTASRSEASFTWRLGDALQHSWRVGFTSIIPNVGYRYQSRCAWNAEVVVGWMVVGSRFGLAF